MNSISFYDGDWERLLRQHPLIARKIEDLRCEVVNHEEFEELRKRVEKLEKKVLPEVKYGEKNLDELFLEDYQDAKGLLQRTGKKANNNSLVFQALQVILKEYKVFCHIGDYKLWFDNDNSGVIDRYKK